LLKFFVANQFGLKELAHGCLRNVIFGWPEPSGNQQNIGLGILQMIQNRVAVVGNSENFNRSNANVSELFAQPTRIRIYRLPDQQLITNAHYFSCDLFLLSHACSLFCRIYPLSQLQTQEILANAHLHPPLRHVYELSL